MGIVFLADAVLPALFRFCTTILDLKASFNFLLFTDSFLVQSFSLLGCVTCIQEAVDKEGPLSDLPGAGKGHTLESIHVG